MHLIGAMGSRTIKEDYNSENVMGIRDFSDQLLNLKTAMS